MLQYYEDQCNWSDLKFPLAIQKIGKFEKNNPEIVVNVLFRNKKERLYKARRSKLNGECKKQVNLLMVVDRKEALYRYKDHFEALIKIKWKNATRIYYCLNGLRTESARDKHYEYSNLNCHVKVKMPTENENGLNVIMDNINSRFHLCCMRILKVS